MKKQLLTSLILSLSLSGFAHSAFAKATKLTPQDEINRIADEIEPLLEDEDDFVVLRSNTTGAKKKVKNKSSRKTVVVPKKSNASSTSSSISNRSTSLRSNSAPGRTRVVVAEMPAAGSSRLGLESEKKSFFNFSMPGISLAPVVSYGTNSLEGTVNNSKFTGSSSIGGGVNLLIGRGSLQLDTGLQYHQHRFELENKINGNNYLYNPISSYITQYEISYLEIPLALRYNFNLTDSLQLFARGGVQFAYLMNAVVSTGYSQNYSSGASLYLITDEDAKNSFNELETRGLVSAGLTYRLTDSVLLSAQVEFQKSITKTSNAVVNMYGLKENAELSNSILAGGASLIWEI